MIILSLVLKLTWQEIIMFYESFFNFLTNIKNGLIILLTMFPSKIASFNIRLWYYK